MSMNDNWCQRSLPITGLSLPSYKVAHYSPDSKH